MNSQLAQSAAFQAEETIETEAAKENRKSDSAFRTISEVAEDLNVQQHVLRFWETKFSQVRPLKRGGGRRYYRPEDVTLLKKIHELLYTQGYTIKGVQKLLREVGKAQLLQEAAQAKAPVAPAPSPEQDNALTTRQRSLLEATLKELKELRSLAQ